MRNRSNILESRALYPSPRLASFVAFAAVVVALIVVASAAHAAYLEDVPQTLVQPDGMVVQCFATGDEYYHWLHDADGYVIVQDPATGTFAYATKAGDDLVATACVAGTCDPRTLGVEPRLKPGRQLLLQRRAIMAEPEAERAPLPDGAPTFTSLNNLVIFVRFADETEFVNPLSYYNSFLNATTGVSLLNYFKEASYNQTTISSTFYPTGGSAVVSYQSSNPRAYYQPYNATTNPQGYNGDDERTSREHALVKAAAEYVASQVPISLNLDTNSDGRVDNITLIVRGAADGWSDLLWPHRWSLYTLTAYINSKQVYTYNFQLDASLGVSVLCHEMGHTLGSPDFYHYDDCSSAPDLDPVWRWELMANNRTPPQHSGAYVKKKYFGWISTIPEITTSGTYTLNPITSSTNNAYRIASSSTAGEYFVVEYRRATGTFESSLPGSGLLVYRVYPDANPSAPGNRCGPPDEVYVYRPNGTTTANGDPGSAAFSFDSARTAISDSTNPSSFLSDGSPGGLNISNVTAAESTISFTVTLGGGGCTYAISPTSTSVAAAGGSGSVTVTAGAGCSWTASSNAGWITVTGGSSGNGNGSVSYSVGANGGAARTGTVTIAGKTFTVNQAGTGGGGEVTIFSDAFEGGLAGSWSVTGTTTWGHSTYRAAGGSGSAWCAGGGTAPQSPGGNYISNQNSWMVYGPFSLADATAASAEFDLWMNTENDYDFVKWMISVNGTNFSGVQASGNNGGWQHKTFNFADVTSLTAIGASQVWFAFIFRSDENLEYEGAFVDNLVLKKTAGGGGCSYSISPTSASVAAGGGSGTVAVTTTAGCAWTAASNAGWITVTGGASGSGSGSVTYSVAANGGAARTGTVTIAGQTFTVNQAASGGGGGTVTVFSDSFEGGLSGSWAVSGATTWGHSTYRAAGGSGSAWCAGGGSAPQSPGGTYVANMNGWMLYGPFSLADATAASAEFDLWFNTQMNTDWVWWLVSIDGSDFWGTRISGMASDWQHKVFDFASISQIQAVGASQVWFGFVFESDGATQSEGAYVDNVVIKKTTSGGGCSYSISPSSASVAAGGGSGTVAVTTTAGCAWTAASNAGWITVTSGASGSGSGSVGYSVASNTGTARAGTVTIAGQTFTVNQAAAGGGGAYGYFLPAIAHNPGTAGTQWRSDVSVVNPTGAATSITLTYYSSAAPVARSATIAANGTSKWVNVLESLFGLSSGTSSQGTVIISSNVPLAPVARTYNQASAGTYGQYYPAVRLAHTIGQGQVGYLPALEKSTAFRTNVGAINLGSSTCNVEFRVYNGAGAQVGSAATLSVAAERWGQLNDLFGTPTGAGSQSVAYAKVTPASSACQVWAYGSVVDAATGDPTTIPIIVP